MNSQNLVLMGHPEPLSKVTRSVKKRLQNVCFIISSHTRPI